MTVKECVENAPEVAGRRIRVSGTIVPGSLVIAPDRQEARFSLSEEGRNLPVVCKGPLPDDLSPGKAMEVVVEGRLEDSCTLHGEKLITKCASKYSAQKKGPTATADLRGTRYSGSGRPCDDHRRATLPADRDDLLGLCGLCGDRRRRGARAAAWAAAPSARR